MPRFVPARYSLLLFSHPLLPFLLFEMNTATCQPLFRSRPPPEEGNTRAYRGERDKGGKLNDLVKRE